MTEAGEGQTALSAGRFSGPGRFSVLLAVGFFVSVFLAGIAVWSASRAPLQQADTDLREIAARAALDWYDLQLAELRRTVNYVATRPEIQSAVLGETEDMRVSHAVLSLPSFNPNVATLLVYDILNAEVLRRSVAPVDWDSLPDRLLQDMVNVQLNSTRSQARVVNARGGQIMLLSAPILHRGSPEGVALSIANLARFEGAANGLLEIRVLRPDEAMLGPDIQVHHLPDTGHVLEMAFDGSRFDVTRQRILVSLIASLAFALILSFTGIGILGNSLLLEPYRLLQSSQHRLRHSERRARDLADIAELANDAIIVTDPDHKIIWVNTATSRLTGYSLAELQGRNPGHLLQGPDTDPVVRDLISDALRDGEAIQTEILNYSKSGKPYWIDLAITPDIDAFGQIRRFIAIERDVTEIRKREATLRGAMQQANSANEAKSMFLANISHEIRTPMNGILGMVDVLEDTALTDAQRDTTGIIRRSAEALVTIINDILDFSRIEAGKAELDPTPADIGALAEEILMLMKSSPYRQDTRLYLHRSESVPDTVLCDISRMRQVLLNVIGNALKFTEQGHVLVTLDTRRSARGEELTISVQDTGCGIAPERLDAVFDAFEQANNTLTRRYHGTGLGLAISRKLMRLMQGDISATSEEGVGSVFTLRLPFIREKEDKDKDPSRLSDRRFCAIFTDELLGQDVRARCLRLGMTQVDHAAEADIILTDDAEKAGDKVLTCLSSGDASKGLDFPMSQTAFERELLTRLSLGSQVATVVTEQADSVATLSGMRILLADDNATNRLVVRKLLASQDVDIVEAVDGQDAFEKSRDSVFDIILMDMSMPVMSGEDATRKIRSFERKVGRKPVPVIALTANASTRDKQLCLEAGMDDFLSKPVRKPMLMQALSEWVKSPGRKMVS
ncbi:MAG: response regulator [Rhodobacteraceae bacterium]|nr:response regulator [Paracoccaceae bacterium]